MTPNLQPWLTRFAQESNRIEGILETTDAHVLAHAELLRVDRVQVTDIEVFVGIVQPDAVLRDKVGLNVRVGAHRAMAGGPMISVRLKELLAALPGETPYRMHVAYEHLHPFTDGNGRSGRALWLWQMLGGTEQQQRRVKALGFPGDVLVGDAECVIVIPAHLAIEVADEAVEMTVYEDFVAGEVRRGRPVIGLYPLTTEQARLDFEEWRSREVKVKTKTP